MSRANHFPIAIVQSDTTVYEPPLEGLYVFATGDLSFKNEKGDTITVTFPSAANGASYPALFNARIRQILDTGTTITDANMIGLKQV